METLLAMVGGSVSSMSLTDRQTDMSLHPADYQQEQLPKTALMLCERTLCQQFHPLLGEPGQDSPAQFSFLLHPCSDRHLFSELSLMARKA